MMMFIPSDFLFAYSRTILYFRFSAREILVVRSLIGQYPELYLDKLRDWILFLTGESYSISMLSRYLCKIGLSVKKVGTIVFMNTVDLRLVLFRGMTLHLQMATKITSCS